MFVKTGQLQDRDLTGLSPGHVGQDPEGLGLHVDTAAASFAQVRLLLCALDGLIDGRGAVYDTIFNWERTATTDRGRQTRPPKKPDQVSTRPTPGHRGRTRQFEVLLLYDVSGGKILSCF